MVITSLFVEGNLMPKISVIMSVYNGEQFLREAIDSILNQTFNDFEFIITDDYSQDNTFAILEEYSKSDSRIIIVKNEQNQGLTKSLNHMIDLAQGEFIARMDADDISSLSRLEKQVEVLDGPLNIDFIFSNTVLIDDVSDVICNSWRPKSTREIIRLLSLVNYIPHPTVMVKSDIFKANKYSPNFVTGQDKELWLRLVNKKIQFYYIDEVLLKYRINFNSVRNKHSNKYIKYVTTCFSNNAKEKATKYFKYLKFFNKVIFIIKYLTPFKIVFYKGLLFRKIFNID
ncbi:MAG: glycosyltransferase involved in cell wall biosynthesis [Colwellia sp.]